MDRKNRLKEAYKYLQSIGKIHTQKGFADALGKAEGTISRAFNGDEKALTDNLFVQITMSFPGLFNLDYLLTGEGPFAVASRYWRSRWLASGRSSTITNHSSNCSPVRTVSSSKALTPHLSVTKPPPVPTIHPPKNSILHPLLFSTINYYFINN